MGGILRYVTVFSTHYRKQFTDIISQRIPTSMTCFGRLLIPEYNGKEKLAKKLKIALENSEGFGVV